MVNPNEVKVGDELLLARVSGREDRAPARVVVTQVRGPGFDRRVVVCRAAAPHALPEAVDEAQLFRPDDGAGACREMARQVVNIIDRAQASVDYWRAVHAHLSWGRPAPEAADG